MTSPSATLRPSAAVIVCAYTEARWADLAAGVVEALAQARASDEVIVVIDHNEALWQRCVDQLPAQVRILRNSETPGASGSRNTGVAATDAEIVVFLDDDAVPAAGWLETLLAAFATPSVMAVGGAAWPRWPGSRPAHLAPELDWIVGCTYVGQPIVVAEVRNVTACNMAVRRSLFDEVGGFLEGAGRVGKIPLGCEETELCIRLRQRHPDGTILFDPKAIVNHRVSADRVTWRYLRTRSHAEGLSKATIARVVGARDATSAEREYSMAILPKGVLAGIRRGLRGDRSGWQSAAGIVAAFSITAAGYVRGRFGIGAEVERAAEAMRSREAQS